MRTTLTIDDNLLQEAKRIALARNCTLGEVVEEALRVAFAVRQKNPQAETPAPLKTFRGSGLQPGVDLNSSQSLLQAMDS